MSKFQAEFELIDEIEEKISDYNQVLEEVQSHITARLKKDVPLPADLTNILSLDVDNNDGQLMTTLKTVESSKISNIEYLEIIRRSLGNSNVTMAVIWMIDWSANMGRLLENVVDDNKRSDIFPPPHIHFSGMAIRIADLFPVEKHKSISDYLRTVENPWAQYAST